MDSNGVRERPVLPSRFYLMVVFWTVVLMILMIMVFYIQSKGYSEAQQTTCAYYNGAKGEDFFVTSKESGQISANDSVMLCAASDDQFCFSAWEESPNQDGIIIVKQGCWPHAGGEEEYCANAECLTKNEPSMVSNRTVKFCCCHGDLCNMNISDVYVPPIIPSRSAPPTQDYIIDKTFNYREETIIIALASVCSVAIVTVISYLVYRLWLGSRKANMSHMRGVEAPPPPSTLDMDNLKISNVIGQGRFGNVWKGSLNDRTVAVKVFQGPFKPYYLNEKEIYSLPYMDHDNVLHMIGAEERITVDGLREYLLVVHYMQHGSLQNYLRNNTFDWMSMCVLGQTMASGLGFLHSDINKNGKRKPALAHRDFNSRNILVKLDGTCVIADFGFTMKVSGSRLVRAGEEDTASISDVGTLRYMSPEVLDGAVNLRDCEVALKQVDVYAMGLVLWEIATRCFDLFPGETVGEYELPFQAQIGSHPSFEDMQVLVSRDKKRPRFPDSWKTNHHAVRSLKETMEDCWDQDAEARLTALCAEERMLELMTLWDKNKIVSPTVNPTSSAGTGTTQTITDRNVNLQNDHGGMAGNADDRTTTTDVIDHNSNFTGVQHIGGRGHTLDLQNAPSAQEQETMLDRNANIEHVQVPQHRVVTREHSISTSSATDRGVLSSLGFDRHSHHLSPDTISTSLSATSDINLGEFSCSQTVDPKNLHHSDEDMQGATTDLKFSQGYGSSLEYSVQSEPSTSPSRPLVLSEMRPSLARDQMTDNLSNANMSVRPKQQNTFHRHSSVPGWGQLTVNQARARTSSSTSRGNFKTDTNRHREQLVAQRRHNSMEGRPPPLLQSGLSIEGQVVNPLSVREYEESSSTAQSLSELESSYGSGSDPLSSNLDGQNASRIKRPTTLALSAGLNGMKKKLVAMYVPNSSRGTKSSVQTGIAKMETNEPKCHPVTVAQNEHLKSKGKGSKSTAAQATKEYSSEDLKRRVAQAQKQQEQLVVNVPKITQPIRVRRDGYESVSTQCDDGSDGGQDQTIPPQCSTALPLLSETSSEGSSGSSSSSCNSRPPNETLEVKVEKKNKRRSTPYKLLTGRMSLPDDKNSKSESSNVKMREGRKTGKGKDRRKVVSVDVDSLNKLYSSDMNHVQKAPTSATLSSSQSESSLHQNGNIEQCPNNKANLIGQARNVTSPSNNERNKSDSYSANNNTVLENKVNSQNTEKIQNGDIIKSPIIANGHPVAVADGQYQLCEIQDTVVKPPPNAVETNDELSFKVSCL
ncbi:uncharacterized protein LOC144447189 [Glandiceps talaboti]